MATLIDWIEDLVKGALPESSHDTLFVEMVLDAPSGEEVFHRIPVSARGWGDIANLFRAQNNASQVFLTNRVVEAQYSLTSKWDPYSGSWDVEEVVDFSVKSYLPFYASAPGSPVSARSRKRDTLLEELAETFPGKRVYIFDQGTTALGEIAFLNALIDGHGFYDWDCATRDSFGAGEQLCTNNEEAPLVPITAGPYQIAPRIKEWVNL